MQPLDKNSLFSIFDIGDEEVYKENNVEELLDNPFVLLGMVVRGVDNWHLMDILYTRKQGEEYKLDFNKFETVYTIGDSFDRDEVEKALNIILDVFISFEHYEKCATVKKFLDLLDHEYVLKSELKRAGLKLST